MGCLPLRSGVRSSSAGDDAPLRRGSDGVASQVELAEEQQQGQQAASAAHHQLPRGGGPWLPACFSCSVFAAH